jgi:AcrR family transcriptional regulator
MVKVNATRKYGPGQDRHDAILDAARRLFHAQGYERTTIDDIGAAAGISGPGIYRHFAGKQDILAKLVEQGIDLHIALLERARTIADRDERLAFACEGVVDIAFDIRYTTEPYHAFVIDRRDSRHRILAAERKLVAAWGQFIGEHRPDLDAHECRALVLMMGGMLRGAITGTDRARPSRLKALSVPLVLRMVSGMPQA